MTGSARFRPGLILEAAAVARKRRQLKHSKAVTSGRPFSFVLSAVDAMNDLDQLVQAAQADFDAAPSAFSSPVTLPLLPR